MLRNVDLSRMEDRKTSVNIFDAREKTYYEGRSYLVPKHLVPTHFVPTPLVKPISNYWFDPNKSDVLFEIFVFFDKSIKRSCSYSQYIVIE